MKILALDLGTKTGWALLDSDQKIKSGVECFKQSRFEGGGMRFLRFKRWLSEMKLSSDGIDAVFFEEVRSHKGIDAAHAYGGFLAHLTAWCEHHNINYMGIPVGTIKKSATGKGNANKATMIEAANKLGHNTKDDNEADAICLLYYSKEIVECT